MRGYIEFNAKELSGRNRRLYNEWRRLAEYFEDDESVEIEIVRRNSDGLPTEYRVIYHIRTICGVEANLICGDEESYDLRGSELEGGEVIFADRFVMMLTLPPSYPSVDGAQQLRFVDHDGEGDVVAMPWHPNIRFYGSFRGRVCLNAMDSFVELAWCVDRVAKYLRYELYHSIQEPPYPEDLRVARWLNHYMNQIDWSQIGRTLPNKEDYIK